MFSIYFNHLGIQFFSQRFFSRSGNQGKYLMIELQEIDIKEKDFLFHLKTRIFDI